MPETCTHQKYILTILLNAIIILISVSLITILIRLFLNDESYKNNSLSLIVVAVILTLFIVLKIFLNKGYSRLASHGLINILFIFATYMGCKWGVDLPAEILFYVLVIVISGILIGSRAAFIYTFIISITFLVVHFLHENKIITVSRLWIKESLETSDILITAMILLIIATVLWLFNRELKKSEKDLKNERDSLEIRVEEKTKELRTAQAKEIAQVHRFAEFGKLSSGLFHDLVNPLTALMLNIQKIKMDTEQVIDLKLIEQDINQAIKVSKKMKDFIVAVRKQISFNNQEEFFYLNNEIEEVISILSYKSKKNCVEIIFSADEKIELFGDAIKFNQIVANILSNAIDACENRLKKEIYITLKKLANSIELTIADTGKGIPDNEITKIFEPFFTTKNNKNLGLGLSLTKKIIEENFLGKIEVQSKLSFGTTFSIKFPLNKNGQ